MRILHIVEAFGGGVFNYVRDLALWQSEEHQVVVMFNGRCETTPEDYAVQFPTSVTLIKSPEIDRSMNPLKIFRAIRAIRKIETQFKPDIIHLHSAFAGLYGRLALCGRNIHLLYSPHAYSFLTDKEKLNLSKTIFFYAEKVLGKCDCTTVCVCESEYRISAYVTAKSICINSGLDTDAFQGIVDTIQNQERKGQCGKTIVMTGRICEQKRPALFNEIAKNLPYLNFIWVGDGPLRDQLSSPNITVTGWTTRQEVVEKVANADVFLFPTEFETISIALLEAMYLERPCVVSNVSGNCDVIVDGKNGFLCNTVSEFCHSIQIVLENPLIAQEVGQRAKEDVMEKYCFKTVRAAYEKFFAIMQRECKGNAAVNAGRGMKKGRK